MAVSDKAVSTEDLALSTRNTYVEVAKLEGVLNTLLESKVEAIKNDRSSSLHSSPKLLVNRLRITSTSTTSSKDKDSGQSQREYKRRRGKRKNSDEIGLAKHRRVNRCGRSMQRISSSSPDSPNRYNVGKCCEKTPQHSDEEANFLFEGHCAVEGCSAGHKHPCCCRHENNGDVQLHFDEDYISLKIEDCDEFDDGLMTSDALRRARRKRRKRRKRRMKRHLAIAAVPVEPQHVKVLEADELPQRARWTIVATACLLLFMCLLLVGVTLRMAPIIDDMVSAAPSSEMSSFGADSDIPFITEIESPRVHSYGNSLEPSPSHSRSPSFRDDRQLLGYRTSSLDDIRRCSVGSFHSYRQPRRNSSRRSRRSQVGDECRRCPSRRASFDDRGARRKCTLRRKSVAALSVEQSAKEKRRRRMVCIVIGTFLFLLFASVLAVMVTLTHRSEFFYENKTTIYYTFAPHPKVVDGDFLSNLPVRKENEELINSINREQHSAPSSNGTSSSSSVILKE